MKEPERLTLYHIHSMLSNGVTNIDSITDFHEYVDAAKKDGATAMGFSEHGSTFAWLKKKEYIEASGMKYIHAVEAYLTEDDSLNPSDSSEGLVKTRDNYHCILIAKNYEGVKEINKMISMSFSRDDYHFYYLPRIGFEELFATSDNVLITTACLGGVLNKGNSNAKERFLNFLRKNCHRCWLEIQHHKCEEQIEYNRLLYELSKSLNIPLIAGTDTHALNDEHMVGRALLQTSKNVRFANEDAWDLTFKTKRQLIEAYKKQNSLPLDVVYEAIENTNRMADMIEEFTVDRSPKYPKLYPNSEEVFKKKINEGTIRRGIREKPNYKEYVDRIHYEYDVYKHNGAIDFMLLEENYKTAMREKGIKYGYSRGSVSGSIIAYLLGITEIDSVKYNLNFDRFMNVERVSLADIDTDWFSEDRKAVRDYLYSKEGLYCCDIVTFNTIALKGAIKDICRGFHNENLANQPPEILKQIDEHFKHEKELQKKQGDITLPMPKTLIAAIEKHSIHKEIPYNYFKKADEIIDLAESNEEEARKKYPNVFRFVDLFVENKEKKRSGVIVSVGNHPAACVVSPYPVDEWFGTFTTSTNDYPISVLNMKEIDSLNFIKLDILGLDNIGLIYKTCEAAGIPFATPDNIPSDDIDVWNSIREDTTMIFQWESPSATAYLKQLFSDETIAKIRKNNDSFSYINLLSIGNGAIRPAGASYRDRLAQGIYQDNGHEALNEFMKPTLGYCVEENQFVHTVNGRKKIKDIRIGEYVYTENGVNSVSHKSYMGRKDTIKICTRSSSLICTNDHKIMSEYGWIEADKLNPGDNIAIRVGNNNTETCETYKLRLLGYLIGDGCLTSLNNVGFVNRDIDVVNDFGKMVSRFYNCTISVNNRGSRVNNLDLYYVNVKHIKHRKHPTSVAQYLKKLGLKKDAGGLNAREKKIPEFIFKLKTDNILQFIGAYTDTDSCIKTMSNRNVKILHYTTASKVLAYDIVEIFRLLGFTSNISKNGEAFTVHINDATRALRLLYDYSFKVRKTYSVDDLKNTKQRTNYIKFSTLSPYVDRDLYNDISLKTRANLYTKSPNSNITIDTIKKIKNCEQINMPSYWFNENIVWVPITHIEECGERDVYDLTINDDHSFVCENILVHNCVYQEQVIEFLHSFCGYTMGEADLVRRGFAKKTGTGKFIPKIEEGFIKTIKERYDVSSDEAKKLIANFLKVIEDASEYLFSKNHSDPYSWIGYICGYLRYYYPLEFITTALNIFSDKEDKSLAIINYAKKHGIKISPIKFRHSTKNYNFNKETNEIYKGIASIKYLNETVSTEMYELRNNHYSSFVDLLYDLKDKTSLNSRQLSILIDLDFFAEFGNANYLKQVYQLFDRLGGAKQLKKEKLKELGVGEGQVRTFAGKETEKMFTQINAKGLLDEIAKEIQVPERKLSERISAQIEHLGYIDIADKEYERMAVVVSVDTRFSPKLKMYSLKNGKTMDCKIQKKLFNRNKLLKGDIVMVIGTDYKPRSKKNDEGKWEIIPGTRELWVTNYRKMEGV